MKVGIDLVKIDRLSNPTASFLRGVYAEEELSLYEKRIDKAQFLAGHYAAKEAFLKALGTGLAGAPLNKVVVMYLPSGQPFIRYNGKDYPISISHEGDYATSIVIIE